MPLAGKIRVVRPLWWVPVVLAIHTVAPAIAAPQSTAPQSTGPRARTPVSLGPSDRTFWLLSGAALVGAALIDYPARDAILDTRSRTLDPITPLGDILGTAKYTVPTIAVAFVAGHLGHHPRLADATTHITLSYVLADATEALLKGLVGRQRPHYSGDAWRFRPIGWSGEWQSFPSGHVTHITAIAAAVAEEARSPWVTALGAGAVGITGWQRMYRDQHWASDVIGGAIIGIAASRVTAHWFRHTIPVQPGAALP
jgi:membrane-associated phospholipid phosphatase